jgi:hypothetical protein
MPWWGRSSFIAAEKVGRRCGRTLKTATQVRIRQGTGTGTGLNSSLIKSPKSDLLLLLLRLVEGREGQKLTSAARFPPGDPEETARLDCQRGGMF